MTELSLHNLKIDPRSRRKTKRIGRGNASGHGTYSGRGLKGQKSRAGGKGGLKRRALKMQLRSKPKIGGFKSLRPKLQTVNIIELDRVFAAGELVTPKKLVAKGLLAAAWPDVKILGEGRLTKKLTVVARAFSESAKKAILEAGGRIELTRPDKVRKSR